MINNDNFLKMFVADFSQINQVEAILLGGSLSVDSNDSFSDYDLYIYSSQEITTEIRTEIAERYADRIEINNQFWETGDEWILRESGKGVDIMFRSFDWIVEMLDWVVIKQQGCVGYTTAFWYNLINSCILYDKEGKAEALIKKYDLPFSPLLKENIIKKNFPILRDNISSYYYQIKKAISREDLVSINHRTAELLASYFDILFAVNEMKHPGEKKMLNILLEKAHKLPDNMEKDVKAFIKSSVNPDDRILNHIDCLINQLEELLRMEGLKQE